MKQKTVILPRHMENQAKHFGKIAADLSGFNEKSQEYKDAYLSGVYEFCYEGYNHSMTPSGELGANPATPRIAKNSYDVLLTFLDVVNDLRPKQKRFTNAVMASYKRRVRAALTSLTHVFLEMKLDMSPDRKVNRKSPMEYKKRNDQLSEKENIEVWLETETNRYERLMVASILSGFLQQLFMSDQIVTNEKMLKKYMPNWNAILDVKKQWFLMKKKVSRVDFMRLVQKAFIQDKIQFSPKVSKKTKGKSKDTSSGNLFESAQIEAPTQATAPRTRAKLRPLAIRLINEYALIHDDKEYRNIGEEKAAIKKAVLRLVTKDSEGGTLVEIDKLRIYRYTYIILKFLEMLNELGKPFSKELIGLYASKNPDLRVDEEGKKSHGQDMTELHVIIPQLDIAKKKK
jgi:hypothetical protein